jgi:uncharacterized protein with HEPN domain
MLDDVEAFTSGGRAVFMQDRKTQYAVIRAYEVIGEIAKRLPDDLLDRQPGVAWGQIKAFRDFLAHNYDRVILANVWQAVEDLPHLRASVEALLAELETAGDDV